MQNDQVLVDKIIHFSELRLAALNNGDSAKANKYYVAVTKFFCELNEVDQDHTVLLQLSTNSSTAVRLLAAFHLLPYDSFLAEKILKQIYRSEKNVNLGFAAKITYSQWKKGELEFPVLQNGKVVYMPPSMLQHDQ